MKYAIVLFALLAAGCSTTRDPHAPRTISVGESGGEVTVRHGQRLRINLPQSAGYEWAKSEPGVQVVIPEGPPNAGVWPFTPVRTGQQQLRFEYRREGAQSAPEKVVAYEVTVR